MAGGPAATPNVLQTDGMVRSREALLDQPFAGAVRAPNTYPTETRFAQRTWHLGKTADANALPSPAVTWLHRMGDFARAQVYLCELFDGLAFARDPAGVWSRVDHKLGPIAVIARPPSAKVMHAQCERVESWAGLRNERASEIVSQVDPPFGYWASVAGLSPTSTRFTLELITLAMQFAALVVQRMKFDLVVPRPADFSGRIQPMVDTPAFFAYPSGHATQSYAVAAVLMRLLVRHGAQRPVEAMAQIARLAERISTNRVVAGLHYPVDNMAGLALGLSIGEYLATRGDGVGWQPRTMAPLGPGEADHDFAPKLDPNPARSRTAYIASPVLTIRDDHVTDTDEVRTWSGSSPALSWLWQRARAEWHEADIFA